MRKLFTIVIMLNITLTAMTQTNISGVVNSYYKVVKLVTAKACLIVDNPAGLNYNDRVMIIQMKGASVNLTNNNTFGSVTSLGNAGNYEIGTICSINGDSVFLFKEILQAYTVSDKVQLVRIPQYDNAIVTDTLRAAPWDSTTGKGGVLAITVYGSLILSAPISVNNTGFRGGLYSTSNTTCSNLTAPNGYFYNPTSLAPQSGSYKGESVASLAIANSGGKGAAANGGGGGNNHNNGGGGGGNISSGGRGGGNSSSSGCTTANPGIGSYALTNNGGSKIFPGGGGGAGHANSGVASLGGGRGGGIMFIQAHTVHNNGSKFLANGQKGGSTIGDGASGGGGGGTIIFDVNNFIGNIDAQAKGGEGGNESDDNTSQKCYGEGGGGGGGNIFFKTTMPAGLISVSGGDKGLKENYLNCAALVQAAAGTSGTITESYTYMQSNTISTFCNIPLPAKLLSFLVREEGNTAFISWEVSDPGELQFFILERRNRNNWEEIVRVQSSSTQEHYQFTNKNLVAGNYQYRLRIQSRNGQSDLSSIKSIRIMSSSGKLIIYPNPAKGMINIIHESPTDNELKIYDVLGKLVCTKKLQKNNGTQTLSVSNLQKGIYLVKLDGFATRLVVE